MHTTLSHIWVPSSTFSDPSERLEFHWCKLSFATVGELGSEPALPFSVLPPVTQVQGLIVLAKRFGCPHKIVP